jgi:membrane-associated phospholipid phosphatase
MPGDDPWSANAGLPVLGNLWGGLVNAAGVSDFADQAVVLPLAVGTALMFGLSGWRRGALAWSAAMGGTLGLILLLKLLRFFACDHLLLEARAKNPSGHTAAAAAVYGGLVAMVVQSVWNIERWALSCTAAITLPLAVAIGQSRLMLGLHSTAEVVVGGAIGVGGAVAFVALAGPPPHPFRISRVVIVGLIIIALFYGFRMPVEAAIKSIATTLWPLSKCI